MADGAKFKLYVEGEKEFKTAINNINSVLKVNRSELSLLAEQYKVTENPMENLKEQQASLSGAMELQTEKSRQIAEQISKTAAVYGEQDARVKNLVISYNESETALAKLQTKYKDTTAAISDAETAMRDMAAAQGDIEADTARFAEVVAEADRQMDEIAASIENGGRAFGQNKKDIDALNKTYEELGAAIKKQQKNVDGLTKDLKKAEKAYGTGSEKTKDYRKQLDEATEALDDMAAAADKNRKKVGELSKDSNSGLDGILSSVKGLTDKVGIEIPGGLDNILGKMGGISSSIGAVAHPVAIGIEVFKKFLKVADSTTESFSDMKEEAQLLGLDTTSYQKLEYAIGKAGGSMESMTEIINPLYSKIKETNEVIGKYAGHMEDLKYASEDEREAVAEAMNAWNEYGVALYDAQGNLRGVDEIFYDLIDVYSQTTNKTERMAKMQAIFGEAASKVNPIVEGGGRYLKEYGEEAEKTGKILSESLVNSMDEVNRTMDNFKTRWENVKNGLGAALISLVGLNGSGIKDSLSYAWSNFKGMFGYATGTQFAPGGWSVVGEKGPEIVRLPRGSEVYPSGVTPRIESGGNVSNYYNVEIRAADVREFNDIVRLAQAQRQAMRSGYVRG